MPTVTLYEDVQRPLTIAELDANFRGLADALTTIMGSGVAGVGISNVDTINAGTQLRVTLDSGASYLFSLPPRPVNFVGARVVGTSYYVGDVYTSAGSAYIALKPHKASPDILTDVNAGATDVLVAAGRNASVYRGEYNALLAYTAGDVVAYKGGSVAYSYFQAFADMPAGLKPDSNDVANRWGLQATNGLPYAYVVDFNNGTNLTADLTSLKNRATALENAMTALQNKVAGYGARISALDGKPA